MVENQKPEQNQLIDAKYFEEISEAPSGFRTFDLVRPSKERRDAEMVAFFESDCQANPDLRPVHDAAFLDEREQMLLGMKSELIDDPDLPAHVRNAYRYTINEMIGEVRMVRASGNGDYKRYERYNHYVYGSVERETFSAANNYFREMAIFIEATSDDPDARAIARQVLDALPDVDEPTDGVSIIPSESAFAAVKVAQTDFFDKVLDGVEIPEEGFPSWAAADPQTEQVMENSGVGNYQIVDTEGVATWSVRNKDEEVVRPTTKKHVPAERYFGLVAGHEIGTHAQEHVNGLANRVGLLALGLDRKEGAGEGKGTLREQLAYDSPQGLEQLVRFQDIVRRHYAVGLALGVDQDGQKREFKETFAILNAVDTMWEYAKSGDVAVAREASQKRTWNLLSQRTYCGSGPGADQIGVYRKNKVYLEGNIAYWKLAAEHPELIEYWDEGKFDLTKAHHVEFLQAVGVLPTDLDVNEVEAL